MSGLFDPDRSAERLPVSLITGFLGSGKTTLLNRLVRRPEIADSAVIINEFGEVALDHLLVAPISGEAVVLASGCVCCAVRGDLQETLRRLLIERDHGAVPAFARVLIETSGLADPASVVQLFLNNPLLGHYLRLDAVIATVDAINGNAALERHWEACKQAAIADRLLITKGDIADPAAIAEVTMALRVLNPAAQIHQIIQGEIDPRALFGVGPFDALPRSSRVPEPNPWMAGLGPAIHEARILRSQSIEARERELHAHSHDVDAFCLTADTPLDWGLIHEWLGRLRAEHGERLLRVKGVLDIAGEPSPIAVHGVHHTFHPPVALACWPDGEAAGDRRSRLVFITQELSRSAVEPGWLEVIRAAR